MRALALLLAASSVLFADGGAVLLHREAGPYVVTVFASPAPPRAGTVDLSALLQRKDTLDPVLDAAMDFTLTHGNSRVGAAATHDQSQNKMLYSASVRLDRPGTWLCTIAIRTAPKESPVVVSSSIAVSPAEPQLAAYAAYLALPFVLLAIFALHQSLLLRRRSFTPTPSASR